MFTRVEANMMLLFNRNLATALIPQIFLFIHCKPWSEQSDLGPYCLPYISLYREELTKNVVIVEKWLNFKALAASRSKAVVLLLLIYCSMYFPLFVGVRDRREMA